MATITNRSKIAIRTTTAPADMGYGGNKTNWLQAPADLITSPAKALDHIGSLKRKFGGASYLVDLRCAGQSVTVEQLTEAVISAEERRVNG